MICKKCNDDKSEDSFSFKNKAKDIRQLRCKSCITEYRKEYYELNRVQAIKKIQIPGSRL